jgi:hypothetical protein
MSYVKLIYIQSITAVIIIVLSHTIYVAKKMVFLKKRIKYRKSGVIRIDLFPWIK